MNPSSRKGRFHDDDDNDDDDDDDDADKDDDADDDNDTDDAKKPQTSPCQLQQEVSRSTLARRLH